jgi:hypothetical protein|uniref:Uncharacterized protein n=1 Tax=Picea glauca TaxID=3330 RepID=A0A117NH29_PICGL|nr:hypothetical protein ABT39_MTgene5909 [Picea glauca]QHR92059.1 hypothetical protein Q903MT_gene6095 [Picea sitchensis]
MDRRGQLISYLLGYVELALAPHITLDFFMSKIKEWGLDKVVVMGKLGLKLTLALLLDQLQLALVVVDKLAWLALYGLAW